MLINEKKLPVITIRSFRLLFFQRKSLLVKVLIHSSAITMQDAHHLPRPNCAICTVCTSPLHFIHVPWNNSSQLICDITSLFVFCLRFFFFFWFVYSLLYCLGCTVKSGYKNNDKVGQHQHCCWIKSCFDQLCRELSAPIFRFDFFISSLCYVLNLGCNKIYY